MRTKKLLVLVAVVVVLATGVPSLVAMPEYDSVETYYSDDTYTVEVGHLYIMCHGMWSNGDWSNFCNITIYNECTTNAMDIRSETISPACSDHVDNDGDGLTDCTDPDCMGQC